MSDNGNSEHEPRTGITAPAEPAVRAVPEPDHGPVTQEVVETLKQDPELAEIAELAEEYV